ncbi:MAG: TlpA family protein disulfide reductase [Rubrobacter sp.]
MEEARAWSEVLPAYEDRRLNMVMISIDPFESEESIANFYAQAGVDEPFPTVIDDGNLARQFGVSALETTIILDENGEEVYRDVAISDAPTLRAELDSVL